MIKPGRSVGRLTDTSTVAKGAIWNVVGRAGPLLVALVATPFLVHDLGVARWGIFTLALSLIGMFGVFDFGFGRALTRLIADRLATGDEAEVADQVITGIAVLTMLGVIGGLVLAAGAGAYVSHALMLPTALTREVLLSIYVLCASAPLVILNGALWGVLSAFQRFGSANLLNMPILAMYYLGPLAVLPFADSLVAVMAVLVACRLVMTLGYWRICVVAMPSLRHGRVSLRTILPLLRFGGWITLSNLIWPVMLYMDRFVIAAVLSAAATGYYATPFDLIVRFSLVPIAIMQTAFPAMTTSFRADPIVAELLFRRASVAIAVILLPAALAVTAFPDQILTLWLGADFAAHSAGVLRIFGIGVVFMCLDTVPVGLLDGIGRPDVNAKLALASLIVYAPVAVVLIRMLGIQGAAIAWTLREILTYLARLMLCARLHPPIRTQLRRLLPALGTALLALVAVAPWHRTGSLMVAVPVGWVAFMAITWMVALPRDERRQATRHISRLGRA